LFFYLGGIFIKPIIGIILRPEVSPSGNPILAIYENIKKAIVINGGIPVGIIPCDKNIYYQANNKENITTENEFKDLENILDKCDGFIAQGGDEFFNYDIKIIEYAKEKNKPVLGICLGMQAMASCMGGTVIDVPSDNHFLKDNGKHYINIIPDSKLHKIIKKTRIIVNSRHHSCVTNIKGRITALADDGIIEAFESEDLPFFIGLEWHPEDMLEKEEMNDIFKAFITACKNNNIS